MRGNSMNMGNSFANGQSSDNGSGPMTMVKSQQGVGFAIRPATIYDGDEPRLEA